MTLASLGYLAAALAFGSMAVLLVLSRLRGEHCNPRLLLASVASLVWSASMALHSAGSPLHWGIQYAMELMSDLAWTLLLVDFLGKSTPPALKRGLIGTWVLIGVASALLLLVGGRIDEWLSAERILFLGGVAATLPALLLMTRSFGDFTTMRRGAQLPLAIGVGGIFVYDLLTHLSFLVEGSVTSVVWQARGFANALLAPAIAVAAKRDPALAPRIYISRHAVGCLATAIFLIVYGAAALSGSRLLMSQSDSITAAVGLLLPALAALFLLLLSTSAAFRRYVIVAARKHFFRTKYDHRAEWLRFIATMSDTTAGDIRQRALRSITQVFGSPGAILFESHRTPALAATAHWPESSAEPWSLSLRRNDPLASFLRRRKWIVDLAEYRRDPARYDNLQLPGWLTRPRQMRLIVPLLDSDELVGMVVLYDPPGTFVMNYEDRDLLLTLGRHVAASLVQHRADEQLAELRQFESYNRMTAFLMHDLKNAVAQLELITYNAERHRQSQEFVDDAISTVGNAVKRIRGLIDTLGGQAPVNRPRPVGLAAVLQDAAGHCTGRRPTPLLELGADDPDVLADRERLAAVFGHLLRNAQEATPEHGTITVTLRRFGREAVVSIADSGQGMTADFVRERLFRPFSSTKGARGMGLGTFQAREYVGSLGGTLDVSTTPGAGTTFTVRLPLLEADGATERRSSIDHANDVVGAA